MAEKAPKPPTAPEDLVSSLARWEGEGGAPILPSAVRYEQGELGDAERRVLECLGAGVVSEWHQLPTPVQRVIFQRAVSGEAYDAMELKTRIARFLHDHKGDSGAR